MRFVLHANALNGDDQVLALLDRLVDRIADEVHCIDVPDADLLQESLWYEEARSLRRKILTTAIAGPPRKAIGERGPHLRVVEVKDVESVRIADKLAHASLVVLVEDREADGLLLDVLVEELGWSALTALWKRGQESTPRALKIVSAAGVDHMPQRIKRAASDAARENRPLRLFALCDSDSRWPGDEQKAVKAVEQTCENHGVQYHVWRKRCAENYIPDEVFEVVRDDLRNLIRVQRFNALLRRTPAQRDHFPVKDRLSEKERLAAIETGLYDESDVEDLILLEERLFAKRPRPLKLLYDERRNSFTADGLSERDGAGEINGLLEAIAGEL